MEDAAKSLLQDELGYCIERVGIPFIGVQELRADFWRIILTGHELAAKKKRA